MNRSSEFISEKKVDYFGVWEEKNSKNRFKLNIKEKKDVKKERKKVFKIVENEAVQIRREELLSFMQEINSLNKKQTTITRISQDIHTKKRQEEIIHAREILKAETKTRRFILTS